jgi:hypothetical protein
MRLFFCALTCFSASGAFGAVYLDEPFNYSDGELTTVSSNAWVVHSPGVTANADPTRQLKVQSGQVVINATDTNSRDDAGRLLNTTFNPSTDNTSVIYGSFDVNFSVLPSGAAGVTSGSYFAHLKSSASNEFYARIGANIDPTVTAGKFRLAVANENWNSAVTFEHPTELSLNTTYKVVFKFDLATDRTTLWVDPASEASTSVTATDVPSYAAGNINAFAVRQGTSGTSPNFGWPGGLTLDNIVIGDSFATVAVPEASSLLFGLLIGAAIGVGRLARNRK